MIDKALKTVCERLKNEITPDGSWRGHLSSSAVSTAVAAFALSRISAGKQPEVTEACRWLAVNINTDGGWGDTPASPSNMTATLLAKAALSSRPELAEAQKAQIASDAWLVQHIGGTFPEQIINGVLNAYGHDRTFSAPILTMCAIAGMLGTEPDCWRKVPRLPFEAAVLPRVLFSSLNLPVVSYAIPALIAVGLVHYRKAGGNNFFHEKLIIPPALRRLLRMTPASGGFLEAAPLTGFVAMCLSESGLRDHEVTLKARDFLLATIRQDGSWPIDTDLSSWLTSLASNALVEAGALSEAECDELARIIRERQIKHIHPFTGAEPGGWGWTDLSGSVPDADDTSAALIALAKLQPGKVTCEVEDGLKWLIKLMNRNGGVPTFCRGWGFLPFDRSCPDISAHAFKAFALWREHVAVGLAVQLDKAMDKIIKYLRHARDNDGIWSPLWFGDQHAPEHKNRVYGTSVVLECLAGYPGIDDLAAPALEWLAAARGADGWGGEPGCPASVETTAKAVSALSQYEQTRELAIDAVDVLASKLLACDGLPQSSPIGLYFASLWYDEKLYPLIFSISALARTK